MRQVILDTETTGLQVEQGHRVIEVGCLEMVNRRLTERTLHYYLNPERVVEQGAFEVHGLSDAFLADKPKFAAIADELIEFISGAELIIHNAPFDVGFLNAELKRLQPPREKLQHYCSVVDSLVLARHKHPGQPNSLDALCRRYKIDNSNRELHGALLDSELLAQVYLALTGGQADLFAEEEESNTGLQAQQEKIRRVNSDRTPLPIIQPTPEELAAHQAMLQQIKEANGHCLWQDQLIEVE